jgi:hypothetical protein
MRRTCLGLLALVTLGLSAPTAIAAREKTIADLSGTIPLGVLRRSVSPKFYQSLRVSPLHDWSVVRGRIAGGRLVDGRVIRPAANSHYDSLALTFASGLTLVANDPSRRDGQRDSALMHFLIYKIADGLMAVSFAHREAPPGQSMNVGSVRLSVKTKGGSWTEIKASGIREDKRWSPRERGHRRLRRMDRMPMDASSAPTHQR